MNRAFTLIEILVAVAITAVAMTIVGGVMLNSFGARRVTDNNEAVSSRAIYVLGVLKKNILDADPKQIICPVGIGSSIRFVTKSGGETSLLCDAATGQIASASATSRYDLLTEGVLAKNCANFVKCDLDAQTGLVLSVGFSLDLGVSGSQLGGNGVYQGVVVPR